jgi:hypothetical protein
MEQPIVFWPSERDDVHLAILESVGLSEQEAIRVALANLAAEMTPVALARHAATPAAA